MSAWALGLLLALHTGLTGYGYRHGARALVRAWAVRAATLGAGGLAGLGAWHASDGSWNATLAAAGLAITAVMAFRLTGRKHRRGAFSSPSPRDDRRGRIDRLGGALLGFGAASTAGYGLAFLAGVLAFSDAVARATEEVEQPAAAPAWAQAAGRISRELVRFSPAGVLEYVPHVGDTHREIRSCIELLNAPPEGMRALAEAHRLLRFAEEPAIEAALNDPAYADLIERARRGDLGAVYALARHEHTHAVLENQEIRDFARAVTPSQLLKDLHAAYPAGAAAGEETSSGSAPAAPSSR